MQTVARLIDQFIPNNYNLDIELNRIDRFFTGKVIISGEVLPGFNNIALHSKSLDIKSATIDDNLADFSFGEDDALIISQANLSSGPHKVCVEFTGKITDCMHGVYPCYYKHDGVNKELIATQFESHHAREAFPCIDEPAAKATFDVRLTTEDGVTVLGNMPIMSQENANNKLITTFDTTPIMSVYLLAWVVGELNRKTSRTDKGVEVNVYATPAQPIESLDFALDIAVRSIEFFNTYFGIDYPLPKCDNVALPDFSSGAMENWGLVTYREIALLADPKTTSVSSCHYVATVIAHELSHQWFGNLVTMEWWNDLWLNESFATFIEYAAVDALEPTWYIWQDFASSESVISLRRDSVSGVQSVQCDVNNPEEIDTLFDGAIVYAKGARLIQMLVHYIGEESFKIGLKHYFETHAYKNTTSHDLWAAFRDSSGKDVESFMTKWISQPGFPVVHANQINNSLSLSQERLASISEPKNDTLWPITLNSNHSELPNLFETKETTISVDTSTPIRLNIGNYAHFITHYDHGMLNSIIDEIKAGKLSPIDRLQLLNEQHILSNVGIISSAELIPLVNSFKGETSEAVWDIMSLVIGEEKKFVEPRTEASQKLKQLAENLAIDQYHRLGWEEKPGESEEDTKLRSKILGLMLYAKNSDVIAKAIEIYQSSSIENINSEIRYIVLSAVIRHACTPEIIDNMLRVQTETENCEL